MNDKIIVILGYPGIGKHKLSKYLTKHWGIPHIKSYTTKPPTRWDYWKYHFIDDEEFNRRELEGELSLLRIIKIPSDDEYLYRDHKFAVAKDDLAGGGSIILNWDGYADLLSLKQDDVIAFLLEAEEDNVLSLVENDLDTLASQLSAEVRTRLALEENIQFSDRKFIDKMAKQFKIYKIDADFPEEDFHDYVEVILKEN